MDPPDSPCVLRSTYPDAVFSAAISFTEAYQTCPSSKKFTLRTKVSDMDNEGFDKSTPGACSPPDRLGAMKPNIPRIQSGD
jgi:hypothetical protein